MSQCKSIGCTSALLMGEMDFCESCSSKPDKLINEAGEVSSTEPERMSLKYPKYYKDFTGVDEADVYVVHDRFEIKDHSGALHHASKKILLSGARTGGKTAYDDIREARDTLTRWLQINEGRF